jgi:hypothetical protein
MLSKSIKSYKLLIGLKFTLILIITGFISVGCSSSGGGEDHSNTNPIPDVLEDNSNFYGTYDVTMQIGSCDEETSTVTMGNDQSRDADDNYIYIPKESNTASFTIDGEEVTITVTDQIVAIERAEDEWTLDLVLEYSADYEIITISGSSTSNDPEDCTGTITGQAEKAGPSPDSVLITDEDQAESVFRKVRSVCYSIEGNLTEGFSEPLVVSGVSGSASVTGYYDVDEYDTSYSYTTMRTANVEIEFSEYTTDTGFIISGTVTYYHYDYYKYSSGISSDKDTYSMNGSDLDIECEYYPNKIEDTISISGHSGQYSSDWDGSVTSSLGETFSLSYIY